MDLKYIKSDTKSSQLKNSSSFMMNIFRGKLVSGEVFPYPDLLAADEKELITSLVGPFEKFFSVSTSINLSCVIKKFCYRKN